MISGKQIRYCPNCGAKHYDQRLEMKHVLSMCCDEECRKEWNLKYARMIVGKDEPLE